MAALQSHSRNDYGIFPVDEIQLFGGNICGRNWTRKIENGAKPFGGAIGGDFPAKSPYAKRCADAFEFIVRQLTDKLDDGAHSPTKKDSAMTISTHSNAVLRHMNSVLFEKDTEKFANTISPITGAHILAFTRSIHR